MERKLQHIFHKHPLILKAEFPKTNDGTEKSSVDIECNACLTLILGPFYCCEECLYFLHKVCAELPNVLDHPIHPQHPLTLFPEPPYVWYTTCYCNMCGKRQEGFVYHCSICKFDLDTICAASSRLIEDKCHMHPLIPIQTPITFPCHICRKEEKGVSYKCTICPFWVHQSCTLLPKTVKHSRHHHHLTLLPSLPLEYRNVSTKCDICYDMLFSSYCSYSCVGCLIFAHTNCAISESTPSSSRDQKLPPDGQRKVFLPIKQIMDVKDNFIEDRDANADNKIDHFDHEHPLFLIEEQINDKTCDACATTISPPFYGCKKCDYFLHKCCAELPKNIDHPTHPQHQLTLGNMYYFFKCRCCRQRCNGFTYRCLECENIHIDIRCASLLGSVHVYHEAHKHPMVPRFTSSDSCIACGCNRNSKCKLQCITCKFILCFRCAMAPPIMNHRYGKIHPFILTYSPPENHYNEYICEICEGELNPKCWFYHCVYADQFTDTRCMLRCGADSNIKYGKSITMLEVHEHKLTFVSCTYDISLCSYCRKPLRTGFSVGLECIPCNFRIHLNCFIPMRRQKKRSTNFDMLTNVSMLTNSLTHGACADVGPIQISSMENPSQGWKYMNTSLVLLVVLTTSLFAAIVVNL